MSDDKQLTEGERRKLLGLARQSIADAFDRRPAEGIQAAGTLGGERGAFVTLKINKRLRGCIGNFEARGSLVRTVQDMARAAAFEDPRFPPLSPRELDRADIEISVLTPLREIEDPSVIEVGRHGIYLIRGYNRGVLLPQVAVEHGWDRDTFLDQTCLKAGMEPGCWKIPETKVLIFSAEIFGEKGAKGDA